MTCFVDIRFTRCCRSINALDVTFATAVVVAAVWYDDDSVVRKEHVCWMNVLACTSLILLLLLVSSRQFGRTICIRNAINNISTLVDNVRRRRNISIQGLDCCVYFAALLQLSNVVLSLLCHHQTHRRIVRHKDTT